MRKFWISKDGQRGNGIKGLAPTLCTYPDNRRNGSGVMQYAAPAPGEKWGPWVDHPNPCQPDGEACGAGGFHFWLYMSTEFAPSGAWPWWVQWEKPLGNNDKKVRVRRYRMRPIHPRVLARFLRLGVGEGANLRNANLGNANLRNANLRNANLFEANLEDANLFEANLEDARWNDNTIWPARFTPPTKE